MIRFTPFWETIKEKGISQYELIEKYGFSTGHLDALRKNKSITLNTLNDIMKMIDVDDFNKVIEYKKDS